tara:strand:- start:35754 stop:35918 length:165 start_codon:yes stop_codon:yes gene_type:complete
MRNSYRNERSDVEECRDKINQLLQEYNCSLMSADEWSNVLIYDKDTMEKSGGFE